MDVVLRLATEQDIPAIHAITQEAFQKLARDGGRHVPLQALNETEEDILHDMNTKRIFLASMDDQLLGSVRTEHLSNGMTYLSRLGVGVGSQSHGVGRILVEGVLDDARLYDQKAVALHTNAKIQRLIRFYYGNGFFIHSTTSNLGYIRALLVHELPPHDRPANFDYSALIPSDH